MHEAEEPCVWCCTGTIKENSGGCFDSLDTHLSWVLVLLFGLILPITDVESAEDVQDTFAGLRLDLVRGVNWVHHSYG